MNQKDVVYHHPIGYVVRNRRRITYYYLKNLTSASKLRLWRLAVAIRPPAKKKRRHGGGGNRRGSKRQVSAASVLSRLTGEAMATLVERVNEVKNVTN